ncbi:unnamed protein product [Miscanthus lutarioriparius]|nr:unnamed protein product [Miscanthus lutarioriparius]
MVEVEFRVNSKCRSWIGSWRKSKSKDHLYPYPIALVARRTGGVKRGKQGLGGRGGSEIQPNLLWTQFFLPIAGSQGRCLWNCLLGGGWREGARMTMPWGLAACIVDMVWAVLAGWVSTCLVIANEVARGMRSGEIGPFVVG